MRYVVFSLLAAIVLLGFASAADIAVTSCCERTLQGAFCQNAPADQCDSAFRTVPTSCDSTSYCKLGTCYDSTEGTCLDNTPQRVCEANGGSWSEERPAQCDLGCCTLGDQASFVSLVRCKRLSGFLGLETNFNPTIINEVSCIASVQNQDKGACVFEFEFEKTCSFTTRSECTTKTQVMNGTSSGGTFFEGKLCSAPELGTNCGPSRKTACLAGKDGVYYVDTCGNPGNIYDASQFNNPEYWTNVKNSDESCNPLSANAGSSTCGNCNYLLGSFCRSSDAANDNAAIGDFICADLNCVDENGDERKHGESWCIADDAQTGKGDNSVGSRFFRRVCSNGEVLTEPCGDLRAQECVEDVIETPLGEFSQAACRVNRWQDCLAQTDELDCENSDRRDCFWQPGVTLGNRTVNGLCMPKNSPGLNFWDSEETQTICSQANKVCIVTFEEGLFGGEECVDNCECLEDNWEETYAGVCGGIGDCGPKVNYVKKEGFREGYKIKIGGMGLLKKLGIPVKE